MRCLRESWRVRHAGLRDRRDNTWQTERGTRQEVETLSVLRRLPVKYVHIVRCDSLHMCQHGDFQTLLVMARVKIPTIEMHSSLRTRVVSIENNDVLFSPWILPCLSRLLCIFIAVF